MNRIQRISPANWICMSVAIAAFAACGGDDSGANAAQNPADGSSGTGGTSAGGKGGSGTSSDAASGADQSTGGTGGGGTGGSGGSGGGNTDGGTQGDAKPADGPSETGDGAAFDGSVARGVFTMDRNTFFGASRCATANVQLCEDFESGMIRTNIWKVDGTAPVVDETDHARGTHALHITSHGQVRSTITETTTFPATNNTYYGRMFVKFAAYSTGAFVHWTAAAAAGTSTDPVQGEARVGGFHDSQSHNIKGSFWGVGTDGTTGDWTTLDGDFNNKPRTIPLSEWMCIEWLHDGEHNETRFWWDETEHPSLHTTPSMSGSTNGMPYNLPHFNHAWVGYWSYQMAMPADEELWIDEVAIDPARIGCSI